MPLNKRKCLICGQEFSPKTYRHVFCSRKCSNKNRLEKDKSSFPSLICQNCGERFKLDFDPKKNIRELERVVCPHCNTRKDDADKKRRIN
jgi:DNA-directed RNA polymerase subunit RPC12/RpoP